VQVNYRIYFYELNEAGTILNCTYILSQTKQVPCSCLGNRDVSTLKSYRVWSYMY